MLRRRLFLNLGPLVAVLLIVAVAAIWLLQRTLDRLDHIDSTGWTAIEHVAKLTALSAHVETDLHELVALNGAGSAEIVNDLAATARELARTAAAPGSCCEGQALPICQRVRASVPELVGAIERLTDDPAGPALRAGLLSDVLLRTQAVGREIAELSSAVRAHVKEEQAAVVRSFRSTVVGLTLVFVLVVNLAVALLLRTGGLVVRPVERLVAATRALGQGRFDHRVSLPARRGAGDEFGELAGAIDGLAERLQAGEKQQMETLAQVALAMNHEINNAIAIIELQLKLLARQSPASAAQERCLTQIQGSLRRMTGAVRALQNVRRIVLTDYLPGMKMLDLERSQWPGPRRMEGIADDVPPHPEGPGEVAPAPAEPAKARVEQSDPAHV